MSDHGYSVSFTVDPPAAEVFAAIVNVRGWWSGEITGEADRLGAEFTYRVPKVHFCRQKVTEFIPGRKIVWNVLEANISFVRNTGEWKDTDIVFEISGKGDKTEVRFTHKGLVPAFECYKDCSNGWSVLVNGNLRKLIETGKNQPSPW